MASNGEKKQEASVVVLLNIVFIALIVAQVINPKLTLANQRQADLDNIVTCEQNLLDMSKAVEKYKQKHNRYPTKLTDVTLERAEDNVMADIPNCPACGKATSYTSAKSYSVIQGDPGRYTICCAGSFHGEVPGCKINEPCYDSLYGIRPIIAK